MAPDPRRERGLPAGCPELWQMSARAWPNVTECSSYRSSSCRSSRLNFPSPGKSWSGARGRVESIVKYIEVQVGWQSMMDACRLGGSP
eukprot:365083-Chlamydomonas_euryale.AAC.42